MYLSIFSAVVLTGIVFGLFISAYFLYRNVSIFNFLMEALHGDNGVEELEKLPDYDYMLWKKFWIWPLRKFKDEKYGKDSK